jgi:hypothetical protein
MSGSGKSVAVATALLTAALALAGCTLSSGSIGGAATSTGAPASVGAAVVAVKIDNVDDARPSTGLSAAEVVYVEPVEGGLTRIVAIFGAPLPAVVGPVRSARQTDLDLLAQWGRPTFAVSGSVPQLLPLLASASLVDASQANSPQAYYRASTHAAPHNLYLHPAQLPAGAGPSQDVLQFGAQPSGGSAASQLHVSYPAASFGFQWSASAGRWLISMDGTPYRSTEAGQLGAATVVVQHVSTHPEAFVEDSTGAVAPIAQTIGTGSATVLRDGLTYAATWSRPTASSPTRFTVTSSGDALPLASGPVWILLVAN